MPTTIHNVTTSEVLDELPQRTSHVTATSEPLSTVQVQRWIDQGAGQLNAIMVRHGVDPETLGDDELQLVRSGIIAFAAAKSLGRTSGKSEDISRLWETWSSVRKTLRETPQDLGASQKSENQIGSNVDLENPTVKRWTSKGFGGW